MKLIYSLIIALVITVGAVTLENNITKDLQNGILRLHIVADDDSKEAQAIKLKVRDAIIKNVSLTDKDFIAKAENEARRVFDKNNVNYEVKGEMGYFYFPKKEYKNITLPEGEYYGVRLVIGNGAGKNWWCIMYPPLCTAGDNEMEITEASAQKLKNKLKPDSYELITSDDKKVKIRFKTVEIIQTLKEYLKQ